jgi:hypothetical protein
MMLINFHVTLFLVRRLVRDIKFRIVLSPDFTRRVKIVMQFDAFCEKVF